MQRESLAFHLFVVVVVVVVVIQSIMHSFIHLVVFLMAGPKPLLKQALHIVRSKASSFR
jgi:hypothetical protein